MAMVEWIDLVAGKFHGNGIIVRDNFSFVWLYVAAPICVMVPISVPGISKL